MSDVRNAAGERDHRSDNAQHDPDGDGFTLDNLRVSESEADRILADLREGLRLLFAG